MLRATLLASRHKLEAHTAHLLRTVPLLFQATDDAIDGKAGAGLRFGPYRTIQQIGTGGSAVVYGAVHVASGTTAAIKVLPAAWGAAPELRARLEREAEILQSIDHPNIIRVLDVGAVDGSLGGGSYLAMEWLPSTLDRVLRTHHSEPLTAAAALCLARGVADGLAAVHAAGLAHRDVKPSNILLREDGWPVLSDFGLVMVFSEATRGYRLTPSNVVVGTADYLAPEQIVDGPVDGRTDVYALGVVLYEMLVGHAPFAGRSPLDILRAHVEEPLPRLPHSVPLAAVSIVERSLQKRPEDRFPSAATMARALDAALSNTEPA